MTDNNLAATVAALKDGDRVRATFDFDGTTVVADGAVSVKPDTVYMEGYLNLWWPDFGVTKELTAVEVLAPELPPEPPVGSGVFHDGRLWQRGSNDYWTAYIDGQWIYRRWAEIQPCVPAVPQEPEVRAEPVGLSTDEPDVPVGSVAVFRRQSGSLVSTWCGVEGFWRGQRWSFWTREYGAPVAVIPAGGDSC